MLSLGIEIFIYFGAGGTTKSSAVIVVVDTVESAWPLAMISTSDVVYCYSSLLNVVAELVQFTFILCKANALHIATYTTTGYS